MERHTLAALAVVAIGSSACTVTEPSVAAIEVRFDQTWYTRGSDGMARAGFALRNTGQRRAFFLGCHIPIESVLEGRPQRDWVEVSGHTGLCPAVIVPASLVLDRGGSYADTLTFDSPGVYRLRVWFGSTAPAPYRYSVVSPAIQIR